MSIKITPSPHGRWEYIPAGGMALTAQQVEDVRLIASEKYPLDSDPTASINRVRALLSATEPAEDLRVHNHTPYRGPGPDGHCAEHAENGRLRGQCMADTAPTVGRCPKELEGDIESFPCVLSAGHRERCKSAGGLTWGYFTPDDPAEEETKAEAHMDKHGVIVTGSPVVPAPTETGPWQTWQEVPEGVWFLTNQNIGCWMRRDGDKVTTVTGGWPVCTDSLVAQAPFVAAEEG